MAGVIDLATYAYHLELDDRNFTTGMDNASQRTEDFKGKLGGLTKYLKTAVVGALAGIGIKKLGEEIIRTTDDIQGALNNLQTKTGSSSNEMDGLKEFMMAIYNNNFGEDFDDIANSMVNIKQVTGLTNEALEKTTENALMIRDTFGFEVEESINTVNSLMQQFGISADEAYTIIAQGAQKGANKNGDMLDILNEYAPQFKSLGFSSEEFMDTLIKGSEEGAFSIDKIGDAVKEFNIRSKDMSKTSTEAYEALGLNADEMFSKFAEGGEGANVAFGEVVNALKNIEDPLMQNQVGVALFGSMFEDLEVDAITSLGNIESQTDMTASTLDGINEVKYNTFGEALDGIKRNLQTSLIVPLGEAIMPLMNDFAKWITENMPLIKQVIADAFQKAGDIMNWLAINVMPGVFKVFDFLKDNVLPPIIEIFEYISNEIIPKLAESFNKWIPVIKDIISGLWDLIIIVFERVKKNIDFYMPYIKTIFEGTFNELRIIVDVFLGIVKGLIDFIVGVFTGYWERAWDGVVTIFSSIFNGIKDTVLNVKEYISGMIGNIVGSIENALDKINIFNRKKVDNKTADVNESVSYVPSYDVGTPFVPNDQLAWIHKGEAIIPADYNTSNESGSSSSTLGSTNNMTFNISLDGARFKSRDDIDYLTEQLNYKFNQSMREVGRRG